MRELRFCGALRSHGSASPTPCVVVLLWGIFLAYGSMTAIHARIHQEVVLLDGKHQPLGGTVLREHRERIRFTGRITAPYPFSAIGAKWDASSRVEVSIRVSIDGVRWLPWRLMVPDGDLQSPSHIDGTAEDLFAQLVILETSATFLEYEINAHESSTFIRNLSIFLIDPTSSNGSTGTAIPSLSVPEKGDSTLRGATSQPAVVSRTSWGCPDGQSSPNWARQATTVTHLIVHHTEDAGGTNYPARIRAIWEYHTLGRGWGDIGYNYLVDPQGVVYEGRAGGDNTIGAHFSCMNPGTMGVALLGSFTSLAPSSPARSSLVRLLAWKADQQYPSD